MSQKDCKSQRNKIHLKSLSWKKKKEVVEKVEENEDGGEGDGEGDKHL